MPRVVAPEFKRNHTAKTGVRLVEARMIQDLANEEGCCPSEIVYLAVVNLLREKFPETCEAERVGASLLVG